MMEVPKSVLVNRLDSVDSGISDLEENDRMSSSWSSVDGWPCSPTEASDLVESPFHNGVQLTSLESEEITAVQLAHDIVFYMAHNTTKATSRHAKTLRRMVDEVSCKHEILFASLVKKLDLAHKDLDCQFLGNVADRMFCDKQYNWGRIVTFFAFAGWLARYCVENRLDPEWPEIIAKKTGDYVAKSLCPWIMKQGGWEAMEEFFKESDNLESKIWRGLLYTVLGLGALATTVAVVR